MLTVGTPVPAWSGLDQEGILRTSEEFRGRWIILYFYPQDDTSGCTKEACSFRDRFVTLSKIATVIGVSADSAESHRSFRQKYTLPFTLIADTDRAIIRAFDADSMLSTKRISYLINPAGMIAKAYPTVDPAEHAGQIEADLHALQQHES